MNPDEHRNDRRLAVVTGASSGIGLELARLFVEDGDYDVVMVADEGTDQAASRLRGASAEVIPVEVDLAKPDGVALLHAVLDRIGRPVDVLVLNAGIGVGGAFVDTALEDDLRLISLNVTSTVHLAKLLIRPMAERGDGRVLVTASVASTMPGPYYATYAASKAFVLSFAEGIRHELEDRGVTVTALMPGPTDTEFFRRADMEDTKVADADQDDPADVARDGYEALMAGRSHVVAGSLTNKLQVVAGRLLPTDVQAAAHARQVEPATADAGMST